MYTRRFAVYGALFGALFPLSATAIQALWAFGDRPFVRGLALAQGEPLMWIIDSAPVFLGLMGALAGSQQDARLLVEAERRGALEATARKLVSAAKALLASVSAFGQQTAETASSVRATTQTMEQLRHTVMEATLTAESLIGVAQQSRLASQNGLATIEASTGALAELSGEVRGLSDRIGVVDASTRDLFDIASAVNLCAERSQRLAQSVAAALQRAGVATAGLGGLVAEMREHAEEAAGAAARVKNAVGQVRQAMAPALAAAVVGAKRAEEGARAAEGAVSTIRKLAAALEASSSAARDIARASREQDQGIDRVLKAMNEICLATECTVASTGLVARQARSLTEFAGGLEREALAGA